jgi:hypothetical protein
LRTDEVEDLTGILNGLTTLQVTIVPVRGPLRVAVWIPGRHVSGVQHAGLVQQLRLHGHRKFREEPGDHMAPGLLPQMQVEGLDRFLSRLVSSKTSPLVALIATRGLRLLKVPFSLG